MSNNKGFLDSFTAFSTFVILGVILDTLLLYFEVVSIYLAVPIFLVWMGLFTTALGLNANGRVQLRRQSYYFLWALILVEVGLDWILLADGFSAIRVFLFALVLALVYLYMNWGKSRRRTAAT